MQAAECHRSLILGDTRMSLPWVQVPSSKEFAMSTKTSCSLSKALWGRSADLISIPGGLVYKACPSQCLSLALKAHSLTPVNQESGPMMLVFLSNSLVWRFFSNLPRFSSGRRIEEASKAARVHKPCLATLRLSPQGCSIVAEGLSPMGLPIVSWGCSACRRGQTLRTEKKLNADLILREADENRSPVGADPTSGLFGSKRALQHLRDLFLSGLFRYNIATVLKQIVVLSALSCLWPPPPLFVNVDNSSSNVHALCHLKPSPHCGASHPYSCVT